MNPERYSRREFLNELKKKAYQSAAAWTLLTSPLGRLDNSDTLLGDNVLEAPVKDTVKLRSFLAAILNYHEVTAKQLVAAYRFCRAQGWRQGSLTEIDDFFEKKIDILDPIFLFTFDDGRLSQYRAIVEATRVIKEEDKEVFRAVIFTLTQFGQVTTPIPDLPAESPVYIENSGGKTQYMWKSHLEELGNGHYLAGHGVNHQNSLLLSPGAYQGEMRTCYLNLQQFHNWKGIDWTVPSYSHPFGGRNETIDKAVGSAGYKLGFAVKFNAWPKVPPIQLVEQTENDRYCLWRIGQS